MLKESFFKYLRFERNYSECTVLAYGTDISGFERYLEEVNEDLNFMTVDSDIVRGWAIALMDDGYTSASVNRKLSSLRSFYRFLLREGKVAVDPMVKVRGPKKKKSLPAFVKQGDMDLLLDGLDYASSYEGIRDRLILELFYATGIRLSELIGLNISDVDLFAKTIKVTGKRKKQRIIPFGKELEEDLKAYLEIRKKCCSEECLALFLGKGRVGISSASVYNLVKKYLSRVVFLKKKSPHVLRHSFATSMLNNGSELEAVKELLGHERLSTTQMYTHTTFEELKKVYEQAHPRA